MLKFPPFFLLDETVNEVVTRHVDNAQLLSHAAKEMAFVLPLAKAARFADLFEELEGRAQALQIQSYGIKFYYLCFFVPAAYIFFSTEFMSYSCGSTSFLLLVFLQHV